MRTMPSAWPTTRPMGWRATFRLAIWSGRGKWRGKSGQATSTSTAQPTSAERRLAATNNRAMVANGAALASRNTWKSRLWRAGAAEAGRIPSRPGLESEDRFPRQVATPPGWSQVEKCALGLAFNFPVEDLEFQECPRCQRSHKACRCGSSPCIGGYAKYFIMRRTQALDGCRAPSFRDSRDLSQNGLDARSRWQFHVALAGAVLAAGLALRLRDRTPGLHTFR